MGREIELKFRLEDPAGLRARLTACGARRIGCVQETNRIFDTTERKLLAADCGLRLRWMRDLETAAGGGGAPRATLAYKGPRKADTVKTREEIEVVVGDADTVATILERLGFREVVAYEKRRETWRLEGCEVCLDELPKLGWFVEIEGPSAAAVGIIRACLGLASATALSETYVEMAASAGMGNADGASRLLFRESRPA